MSGYEETHDAGTERTDEQRAALRALAANALPGIIDPEAAKRFRSRTLEPVLVGGHPVREVLENPALAAVYASGMDEGELREIEETFDPKASE